MLSYFRPPHLHKTDVIIRQILRPQTLKVEPKTCPNVLQIAFTLSTSNVFYKYNSLIISCLNLFYVPKLYFIEIVQKR
jgi:hypothetical protein